MDLSAAPGPPKRRRTSSFGPSHALPPPSPRRRSSGASINAAAESSKGKGKQVDRNPLAGFDDREEEVEEVVGAGVADEPVNEEEHCAICLSPIVNMTVISPCQHRIFCFACIRAWSDQSRRCPLCLGNIHHLIHSVRGDKDYSIHHLHPLPSTSILTHYTLLSRTAPFASPSVPRHSLYGRRANGPSDSTWREREEERAVERRAYVYREGLFAKHIASNRYTGFKPFTPQSFAANADLKARVIKFIRRELQVFPNVDISFLTTYIVSIASQLDLRSASAIRLLSDFLSENDAEHFAHEVSTFARSPFTTLEGFDRCVQYGRPERAPVVMETVPVSVVPALPTKPLDGRSRGGRGDVRGGRGEARRGRGGRGRGGFREPHRERPFEDRRMGDSRSRHPPPRSRSRSRSRERPRLRSRSRSRSRSRERYDRRRSDQGYRRARSPSYSRSRSRSRSRNSQSRSRSPSRTPPRQSRSPSRSPSPTSDSRYKRSCRSTPPQRSPRDESPPRNGTAVTLSIFGAARRKDPVADVVDRDIRATAAEERRAHEVAEAQEQASSLSTREPEMIIDEPPTPLDPSPPTPLDPSPLTPLDLSPPMISDVSPPMPSDSPALFRSKLQSRLMAEYRTALANKAVAPPSNGVNLREILKKRLRAEKELAVAQEQGWAHDDEEDDEMDVRSPTVFSSEMRALLLARLEEEKGKTMEVMPLQGVEEEREETKEEKLRKALALRRASKTEAAGEAKAKELRDKLKERLLAARKVAS